MHFGLRGRQEHHDMKVEDLSFQKDDGGVEFVTFSEGLTKTRGGGLRVKPRLATPKMFATGKKRCPVALLKKYLDKRPEEVCVPQCYRQATDQRVVQKKCPWVKTP